MASSTATHASHSIYEPVDAAKKEFRLLRILPGHRSSTVKVQITKEYLSDKPPFAALSYTWGQYDPDCHIEVNSVWLPVTKNLLRFLLQVRQLPEYADRYFWTDAICVDQTNIVERGQQVSLMANIYSSAALVVLWLGPAYEDSDLAMHAFTRMAKTCQSQEPQSQKLWRPCESTAIRRICQRRYWTRLWVLQELALADGKIDIMCGRKTVRWADYRSFILHIAAPLKQRAESNYAFERIMNSPARAMSIQVNKTSADSLLFDQILTARHLQCTDRRDKVYGVLGIAKLTNVVQLRADYNLSVVALAHQVLQHEFDERPPAGLDDVRQTCQELANILDVSVSSILSCQDLVTSDLAERALLDRPTGIDVRWAVRLQLWGVAKVWYAATGLLQITGALRAAIKEQATAAIHIITDTWRQLYCALNSLRPTQMYPARCGVTMEFTFILGSDGICGACMRSCQDTIAAAYGNLLPFLHLVIHEKNAAAMLLFLAVDVTGLAGTDSCPPALHVAVAPYFYSRQIIRLLIERTNINERAKCGPFHESPFWKLGDTPLIAAVRSRSTRGVKTLLESAHIDVNAKDYSSCPIPTHVRSCGYTALGLALSFYQLRETAYGRRRICEYLLAYDGLDIHSAQGPHGAKALHIACATGIFHVTGNVTFDAVQLLLDSGADPDARDDAGRTPLHIACELEDGASLRTVRILLSKGVDVNALDRAGRTPLDFATSRTNNTGTIALLIHCGAILPS